MLIRSVSPGICERPRARRGKQRPAERTEKKFEKFTLNYNFTIDIYVKMSIIVSVRKS